MQLNYFADCSLEIFDDPSAVALLEVSSLPSFFKWPMLSKAILRPWDTAIYGGGKRVQNIIDCCPKSFFTDPS